MVLSILCHTHEAVYLEPPTVRWPQAGRTVLREHLPAMVQRQPATGRTVAPDVTGRLLLRCHEVLQEQPGLKTITKISSCYDPGKKKRDLIRWMARLVAACDSRLSPQKRRGSPLYLEALFAAAASRASNAMASPAGA